MRCGESRRQKQLELYPQWSGLPGQTQRDPSHQEKQMDLYLKQAIEK